ncbi:M16 family metallopeptidase [Roseofilum casamattae]|uniref:Pitrilysin family protein n=1 Tax=Roseofilum casamattae BLCC-M143 TaxID=3022442 RepID=A0ABT7C2A8_9CYAN|nr:pitrilysin family protein [Roseofilum casamattae]MDJ1184879.1 pitrilysin family protein [Roseofilum casamattae BLCC-M143]
MIAGISSSLNDRHTHRIKLNNGIVLLVVENPVADIISTRCFLRCGSYCDPPENSGIANLVSALLTKGTPNFSSTDIAERIESVGASCGVDVAADYLLVSLKTVSEDFAPLFALLAEMMRSPTFPRDRIELEKRLILQSIRQSAEQPFSVVLKALREGMYGEHPYGKSTLGTEESVKNITKENLHEFHQNYFRPDNLVISICGRASVSDAVDLVEKNFGDWQVPDRTIPRRNSATRNLSHVGGLAIAPQETQQSIVMVGYPGASVNSDDYPALKLLNTYLGNGLSSRLFVELREKRGLAYDVSAFYPTRQDRSMFVAYMGTAPSNTEIALSSLKAEVARLSDIFLKAEELTTSKNKLLGQYALGKQTNSQIAHILGWYETLGLGIEFDLKFQEAISSVTIPSAREIAERYLTTPYVAITGPEDVVNAIV